MVNLIEVNKEPVYEAINVMGPITVKSLSDYIGCSQSTMARIIKELKTVYPKLRSSRKGYFIEEEEEPKEEKISMKNHEGYPDPTASIALNNIAKSMMDNGIKEPIATMEPPKPKLELNRGRLIRYGEKPYVIVGGIGPNIFCCPLKSMKYSRLNDDTKLIIVDRRHAAFIDSWFILTINVTKTNIQNTNFYGVEQIDEDYMDSVSRKFAEYFNCEMEKSTETNKDFEMELIKQRADIYEKAFYAVAGK